MNYLLVGINHKTAGVALREKTALSGDDKTLVLKRLKESSVISEATVLSTCNRVELYGVTNNPGDAQKFMQQCLDAGEEHLYIKHDNDAVRHLFSVASSLDSLVMGENQILGQVKDAYREAQTIEATGFYLNKLFDRALFVAKRVKTETEVGRGNVSVGSVAAILAKKIFGTLDDKSVVLIGAGEIGELVVRYLSSQSVKNVFIVNRTEERAQKLSDENLGVAKPWLELDALLIQADIVITSISGSVNELTRDKLAATMKKRQGRALFIIDLGVPRNVDPLSASVSNVYYYNIDDLSGIADGNQDEREKAALKAKNIIDEEVRLFYEKYLESNAGPILAQLGKKFEEIRQAELARTFAKASHWTSADRYAVDRLTSALISRVLHDPILSLKNRQDDETPTLLGIFKRIFKLEDEG